MLTYSKEVKRALKSNQPVVALESTIIAHGLPYPENLKLAAELEEIVHSLGATPATIGLIDGEPVIGLNQEQLELMAQGEHIHKVSVRDLAIAKAKKLHGATTVASTAYLAAQAGIPVFATGGLGGVHRDAKETYDISADLLSLTETPLIVVSSGVKSILDIGATLEYLETASIPVVGYRTNRFPGFYVQDSGYSLDWSIDSPKEAAAIFHAQREMQNNNALLVANPVPEEYALDAITHEQILKESLTELNNQGIHGKKVTPFLLKYFKEKTQGESLTTNLELVKSNVRLASQIAIAIKEKE